MKQNNLSIDFKLAVVESNNYVFNFNVQHSIQTSTEIMIQNFDGKKSVPAYYIPESQKLIPIGIDGYWTVSHYTLTFTAVPPGGDIAALEARVDAIELELRDVSSDVDELVDDVADIKETLPTLAGRVDNIVSYLSSAFMYRAASGNPAIFTDGSAGNFENVSVTITPTQSGSGDPSPSNIRPISGVSSVTVKRTGRNVFSLDAASSEDGYNHVLNADGSATFTGTPNNPQTTIHFVGRTFGMCAGTYNIAVTYDSGSQNIGINAYLPGNAASGRPNSTYLRLDAMPPNGNTVQFTALDKDNLYVYSYPLDRNLPVSATARIMVAYADEGTVFEPYQGQSVTVQLTDGANPLTVYGGTLDVTSGTLTVTWGNIASYNGETLPGRWMSDRDVYVSGATPTTGAQVIYELATPLSYQLAPQQLVALSGYNVVSTDAGSVRVMYLSDGSLYFN